jgi:hypothetical protein
MIMGQKLLKLYEFIEDEKGFTGRMAVAMRTKIPSTIAASQPDSPENIGKFLEAISALTGKRPQI